MDLHGKHLLEGLSDMGHQVVVISTKHPSNKDHEIINGVHYYFLKNTTFGSSRREWKHESLIKFRHIIETEKIDVVISQSKAGYSVVKMAKNFGLPFVTILHGYELMVFYSIFNQIRYFGEGYILLIKSFLSRIYYTIFQETPLLLNSTKIITVSQSVADIFKQRPFVKEKNIEIINYGIDINIFQPSNHNRHAIRNKFGFKENDHVVLYLSLISKQKGADIAVKAIKQLVDRKDIKLILAGDGEYLNDLKYLVSQYHLESRVVFTGFINNDDTSKYYQASDIFIFPTLRLESFGIVIAEAMACKKPVIASNIGSVPNVIVDGVDGLLIHPGDYDGLAKQIIRLINDKDLYKNISEAGYLKAKRKYNLGFMIKKTEKVLESAIHQIKGDVTK
ncbi:MAG: glycosyltransferase family 4 protein [Deltaproteobacteria bacterium]|nr:glycosyltransferase family 4 protein [Deltaproteobacteria bacterium]